MERPSEKRTPNIWSIWKKFEEYLEEILRIFEEFFLWRIVWGQIFEGCTNKDNWRKFEGYLKYIWRIFVGYFKDIWRAFSGYIWNILKGYLKDIYGGYLQAIWRIMRNGEAEMKVWSPTGAHLSALKGALLVPRWSFWRWWWWRWQWQWQCWWRWQW